MHKLIKLIALTTLAACTTSCQQTRQVTPLTGKAVAGTVVAATEISVTPQFPGRFIPRKIGPGDHEFATNGPDVNCSVRLEIAGPDLVEVLSFHAKETKHNWTEVDGAPRRTVVYRGTRPIWAFAQGQLIGGSVSYRDNGNSDDRATTADPNQPVQEIVMVGRYQKREAGVTTGVKSIRYRAVRLIVE